MINVNPSFHCPLPEDSIHSVIISLIATYMHILAMTDIDGLFWRIIPRVQEHRSHWSHSSFNFPIIS